MIFQLVLVSLLLYSPIYSQFVPEKSLSTERLSNNYSPQFLRLLQIAFGSDEILSQGGTECIDIMFASVDLNNKKVLDIGSGFGGVDIYLAEQFNVEIVGVDMEPYMISVAEKFQNLHKETLLGKVSFFTLEQPCSLNTLQDESFDLIFSKETFYNVPRLEKQSLLSEAYRKLKPGGLLIIFDWFQSTLERGETLKRACRNEKICQLVSPDVFSKMLENSEFQEIFYEDHTEEHIRYSRADCERLKEKSAYISEQFGEMTYEQTLKALQNWLAAQEAGELSSCTFFAKRLSLK